MSMFAEQLSALARKIDNEILNGQLNFPTAFDISLRIKRLADNPDSTLDELAKVVMTEPVLSARVVKLANSVLLNPYGNQVSNVRDALKKIGLDTLRCLAFAVSAEQISLDRRAPKLRLIAAGLWMYTLDTACWTQSLAKNTRIAAPDNAFFAAIMHHLGDFFLIARIGKIDSAEQHLEACIQFIQRLSSPIRHVLIHHLELPENIETACLSSLEDAPVTTPASLADLLQIARLASKTPSPLNDRRPNSEGDLPLSDNAQLTLSANAALIEDTHDDQRRLMADLKV